MWGSETPQAPADYTGALLCPPALCPLFRYLGEEWGGGEGQEASSLTSGLFSHFLWESALQLSAEIVRLPDGNPSQDPLGRRNA